MKRLAPIAVAVALVAAACREAPSPPPPAPAPPPVAVVAPVVEAVDAAVPEPAEVAQTEEENAPPCLDGPQPPLMRAVVTKDAEQVRALLKAGANADLCHDAGDGSTARPLETALSLGHFEIAKALLEAGANPNLTAGHGEAPLELAEQNHAPPELIELLRKKGARAER